METATLILIVASQHGRNVSRMDVSTEVIFLLTNILTTRQTTFCLLTIVAEKDAIHMKNVATMLRVVKMMMTVTQDFSVLPQDSAMTLMNVLLKLEQDLNTVELELPALTKLDILHVHVTLDTLVMFQTLVVQTLMNVPTISILNVKRTRIV